MQSTGSMVRVLQTACAAALLAGCQGQPPGQSNGMVPVSAPALAAPQSALAAAGSGELLYSATLDWNAGNGQVYVYHAYGKNTSPIGHLDITTGFPEGLWTDRKGNLYIAVVNAGPSGNGYVAEYSPGLKKLLQTYTVGLAGPSAGAFDAAGNLYVTNLCQQNAQSCGVFARPNGLGRPQIGHTGNSQSLYGYVSIYPPGSTQPSSYLYPPITNLLGVSVDAKGDVFVIDLFGAPVASEFPAGSTQPETVPFKGLPSQPSVTGIAIDPKGDLVLAINRSIDFFPHEKGKPSKTLNGMIVPWDLAYGSDGTLFAGNYEFEQNEGNVVAYPPGSKSSTRTYAVPYNNGVTGVAVGAAGK